MKNATEELVDAISPRPKNAQPVRSSRKNDDFLWLPMLLGFTASVHSLVVITLEYVNVEFLQGALIALGTVSLAWLFYKGYRKATR